nr:M23 family metallopeptidase [Saprospiraceae bacterium]
MRITLHSALKESLIWGFTFLLMVLFTAVGSENLKAQNSEKQYPTFSPPVNYPLSLSGTFGELRRTGFHFGVDFRSQWTGEEDLILSIGDGYVSRIAVSAGGYGNAVYINHPNGYTSVYAHLDRFAPEIEALLRAQQYAQKSFEVNFYPRRDQLPVKEGQFIGTMGNTGHSFGPHLHFEIRKSDGQIPLNPLLFGMEVADHHAPVLQELGIHILDEKGNVLERITHPLTRSTGNQYRTQRAVHQIPGWQFGLSIKGHDRMTGTNNRNGIYYLALYVDDELYHEIQFDRLAYSERPYFRTHVSHAINVLDNKRHHLLYKHSGNKLQIYCDCPTYGIISAFENQNRQVKIVVADFQGNQSTVEFEIVRSSPPYERPEKIYTHQFNPNEPKTVVLEGSSIHFPANGFFKEEKLQIREIHLDGLEAYSPVLEIVENGTAFYNRPQVRFHQPDIPVELRDKVYVGQIDEDLKPKMISGNWNGNKFVARISSEGKYALFIDTIPPEIKPKRFRRDARGLDFISFEIADDLPSGIRNGGISYQTYINGEWALFEFDSKSNTITHRFDRPLPAGTHQLKIEVVDAVGNKTVREWEFLR